MKKVTLCGLVLLFAIMFFAGCTENERVKKYGGTATTELTCGEKLVNITWKEDSLWILTRPMKAGDIAETYEFKEDSKYGVMEGKIVITECTK